MTKTITALLFASALILGACASTTDYGPAASGGGYGYSDQAIETNRHRVSFRGRNRQEAEDGALRRAAEVTQEKGFDHFTVVSRDLDTQRRTNGSSIGIGGATGGRNSSIGLGVNVPLGGGSEDVTVRLEIIMGAGDRPDAPRSYDASSVLGNLGAP